MSYFGPRMLQMESFVYVNKTCISVRDFSVFILFNVGDFLNQNVSGLFCQLH